MEEYDLLKERLQAITEKHRIQESIRQKKLELDQEKLELHRLKKKVLKEQWLLQDSASHNATNSSQIQSVLSDQQQTRALQLNIHKKEMEVDYLEREESMISVNESFILNRLKTVEKSPEDIIKEAQDSFVPDQFQVTTVVPDQSFSPPGSVQSEVSLPAKTVFAMEINVAKNMLTGESKVLSTADVAPEDIRQHAGLKVFEDETKCIYAFSLQEGSAAELSASEVEHLLRSASEHRQLNRTHQRSLVRGDQHQFYNQRDEPGRGGGHQPRNQGPPRFSDRNLRNDMTDRDFGVRATFQRRPQAEYCRHRETSHSSLEDRSNRSDQHQQHGNHAAQDRHYGNLKDSHSTSFHTRTLPGVSSRGAAGQHAVRSGAPDFPPPRSHEHKVATVSQPELCYTPAQHIPLSHYVSVDEEQLYCPSTPRLPPQHHAGSAHCHRARSPLYGDDTPYTILNAIDTTEPVTAIFMGFQMAMDDSGQMHGCDGALKAELVIIGDEQEACGGAGVQEKRRHAQPPRAGSANGKAVGGTWAQHHGGAGIRKIQKKQKPCCSVC